jgi:murein DD-endopeptidase MepM/ murein hydrolase activator NlpD
LIFPSLAGKTVAQINMDEEAVRWLAGHYNNASPAGKNPLLNPTNCQQMLDECHQRLNVVWSYGGYLEDRRHIWSGSYLDQSGNYIHLGIDFNVPQGTKIICELDVDIIIVDDDRDEDGGWGQRIITRPQPDSLDIIFIYSHLQNIGVNPGSRVSAGATLAEVGGPPHNGNWHPHLHIQAICRDFFYDLLLDRFHELDGYGAPDKLEEWKIYFPDPLSILKID